MKFLPILLGALLVFDSWSVWAATEVAITVDDLPRHADKPDDQSRTDIAKKMLAALKKHGVSEAYGFVNVSKVVTAPREAEVLRLWVQAGFPLGNHAYSHPSLTRTPVGEYTKDIENNETALKECAVRARSTEDELKNKIHLTA